jgi:tRNA(Ser,Leu) C12 N-acetylase TAN1
MTTNELRRKLMEQLEAQVELSFNAFEQNKESPTQFIRRVKYEGINYVAEPKDKELAMYERALNVLTKGKTPEERIRELIAEENRILEEFEKKYRL